MFPGLKAKFDSLLNSGIGPSDPRWSDRALMGRIRVLNGYAMFQIVAAVLALPWVIEMRMWLSLPAHDIKGACANLKATGAAKAAERLEVAVKTSEPREVRELAGELSREVRSAIEFLAAKVA